MKDEYRLSDVGKAEQMADLWGDTVRYCHNLGKWLIWDEMRWAIDEKEIIWEMAKKTVVDMFIRAMHTKDSDKKMTLMKWALATENRQRLYSMIQLCRSEVSINTNQMDQDPWLFNVENGTVDLRNGSIKEHKKRDMISKLAPVRYDGGAKCRRWDAFMLEIMENRKDLVEFVQKAIGYAMTGDTREQCIFILYGVGANGKSTFIETVNHMMGGYGMTASPQTLMVMRTDSIRNDIARLEGSRMVVSAEANRKGRFDEGVIKQMTGQEMITARFLYKEAFEFEPTWKVFLSTNYKPEIAGTDHAIWRRIRLIPFDVIFRGKHRDLGLKSKLMAEMPGILNWAVEGCLKWQEEGLRAPEEVTRAVRQYRAEMDVLGQFIEESLFFHQEARCTVGDLYDTYSKWCRDNGVGMSSKLEFGIKLHDREPQLSKGRSNKDRFWRGVGISRSVPLKAFVDEEEANE